jgi:Flp pilus assembly protein TadG
MRLRGLVRGETGSAALDFALIAPVFFILLFGIIAGCALYFSQASMHMAAEAAARYWAVSDSGWTISSGAMVAPAGSGLSTPPVSASSASTGFTSAQDYAKRTYLGVPMASSQPFTASLGTCGSSGSPGFVVTASTSYGFTVGFWSLNVPVATSACYPVIQ